MLTNYKDAGKFLFSTFTKHGVAETIQWFAGRGITFHEENEGRLFPITNSAETIRKTLIDALREQQVSIRVGAIVSAILHDVETGLFTIQLSNGKISHSHSCIVATGGMSRPETGSTGEGFSWLSTLGHTIKKDSLSLVPLMLHDTWVEKIRGVTIPDCKITLYSGDKKQKAQRGKILFTHTGVSGPTILNISSMVKELLLHGTVTLVLDLFPELDDKALRSSIQELLLINSNQKIKNVLARIVPRALALIILELLKINSETPTHSLLAKDRVMLVFFLKHFPLHVKGLLGADKAIVSSGGVSLTEIDFKTMGSLIVPNLFLVGDVLDIDRPSGGYSLQLCWSTGYVAGSSA